MIRMSGMARLLLLVLLHRVQAFPTARSSYVFHRQQQYRLAGTRSDQSLDFSVGRGRPTALSLLFRLFHHHPTQPTNVLGAAAAAVTTTTASSTSNNKDNDAAATAFETAQTALERMARRGKSWRRLRHLVELAIFSSTTTTTRSGGRSTIADVGTDHGLLAMALAVSGRFERVYGVDVSLIALQNGAWKLHRQMQQLLLLASPDSNNTKATTTTTTTTTAFNNSLPVEFLMGDGLTALQPGQADTICIAGMGVHTMVEILTQTTLATTNSSSNNSATQQSLLLHDLGCQRLILQPTNTRPRHLIRLYDTLRDMGWALTDERIEYLSSRWYFSSCFVRRHNGNDHDSGDGGMDTHHDILPGALLATTTPPQVQMRRLFLDWVAHNCRWIRQDLEKDGSMSHPREVMWLNEFKDLLVVQPRRLEQ